MEIAMGLRNCACLLFSNNKGIKPATVVREVKNNKLLLRKYTYDLDVLENLATKRFNAEMRNIEYPRILPIT